MKRPYFNSSIIRLESLFRKSPGDVNVLRALKAELSHRKTHRAKTLSDEVQTKLSALKTGRNSNSVAPSQPPSHQPSQTDLLDNQKSNAGTSADSNENGSSSDMPRDRKKGSRKLSKDSFEFENSDQEEFYEPPDDIQRPKELSKMRPLGTSMLPNAWVKPLSQALTLDIPKNANLPELYIVALEALISEIKKTGAGQKRIELENGVYQNSPSGDAIYSFLFNEEAVLFEEAKIDIEVYGRRISGSIVSIEGGRILLSLKEAVGDNIGQATIIVDATALLEALKEKITQVVACKIPFNREMADATVQNIKPPSVPDIIPSVDLNPLNAYQQKACRRIFSEARTYIWGPPGTGKTQTLALAIQAAFAAEKRILICSNTNKAVDQVLYRLCMTLGTDHEALEEGKIVRVGRITDDKLRKEFEPYVEVDSIAKRLGRDLEASRQQIQGEIKRLDIKTAAARALVEKFEDLDQRDSTVKSLLKSTNEVAKSAKFLQEQIRIVDINLANFGDELQNRKGGFLGFFQRKEESIKNDINFGKEKREKLVGELNIVDAKFTTRKNEFEKAQKERSRLRTVLEGENRKATENFVSEAKEVRGQFESELRDVDTKLSHIRVELLRGAKIIGATCTKTYMTVRDFGMFDMVIIDEASMVMLPVIWFAAGLAQERIVVCGDFCQIPPIVQTREEAISAVLEPDVFRSVGLDQTTSDDERMVALESQYRMQEEICNLISGPMYDGRLTTAKNQNSERTPALPSPYNGPITVVDTSELWPFETVNAFYSRFNLMHALLVRNLAWYFSKQGYISNQIDLGICTPYSAHSKLIRKLIDQEGIVSTKVQVGTVHSFQGDERNTIVIDIPEGIGGGKMLGQFVQGLPDHVGGKLMNVAISRAKFHLIFLVNITHLDKYLPSSALLRGVLYDIQEKGKVVRGSELLALRPIERDLEGLIGKIELDVKAESLGIFNHITFDPAFESDIRGANSSIVIFSGFITQRRVSKLGDLLRGKIVEGVSVRCVTRPPHENGSMNFESSKLALDALEGIGCVVDCRARIHEKIVIIDDKVIWHGSLNVLSHSHKTDESMTRQIGRAHV